MPILVYVLKTAEMIYRMNIFWYDTSSSIIQTQIYLASKSLYLWYMNVKISANLEYVLKFVKNWQISAISSFTYNIQIRSIIIFKFARTLLRAQHVIRKVKYLQIMCKTLAFTQH